MLSGHAISFHDDNNDDGPVEDPISEIDENDDEEAELSGKVLYRASFEELENNYLKYDTVIWILISLLLILAWGIGVLMLLYLPVRRYTLRKDISSRKLYVTADEIVYKVFKPSLLPFMGYTKMEKRVPLSLVIDIIIEQGCLQAVYGIHTIRIENIAHRKPAPMDELHVQGLFNPGLLRKVIVAEASRTIQEIGYPKFTEADSVHPGSLAVMSTTRRLVSYSGKGFTPQIRELGGLTATDLLVHKLEEVKQYVKNIEQLIVERQSSTEIQNC